MESGHKPPALAVGYLTIKMLEAYRGSGLWPALLWHRPAAAPRLWRLVVAGVLMAIISLSSAAVVDMTPAAQRA